MIKRCVSAGVWQYDIGRKAVCQVVYETKKYVTLTYYNEETAHAHQNSLLTVIETYDNV